MREFEYDDRRLQLLFGQFQPGKRRQMLRGALRKVGRELLKSVRGKIRESELRDAAELARGARMRLTRTQPYGFYVSVGALKGSKKSRGTGMHVNRRGLAKPILMWMEDGTDSRYTGKKRYRGSIEAHGFLAEAAAGFRTGMNDSFRRSVGAEIIRIAEKNGIT